MNDDNKLFINMVIIPSIIIGFALFIWFGKYFIG